MKEPHAELCAKIARLVQERGWNGESFARLSGLNRMTVRSILHSPEKKLHNATVAACARALGISVLELRDLPIDRLLTRLRETTADPDRFYLQATQPELLAWREQHPERAEQLRPEEWEELLSLQGTGGPLTHHGVEHFVEQIERKRRLLERVRIIAGTEYLDWLEKLVGLVYEKIQPYPDRS